jgi:hypothetical protein
MTQTSLPLLSSAFVSRPVKHSLQAGTFIINPWPPGNGVYRTAN